MKYKSSFMCNGMFMCTIVYTDDVLPIDIHVGTFVKT